LAALSAAPFSARAALPLPSSPPPLVLQQLASRNSESETSREGEGSGHSLRKTLKKK
jgi:hypothetical protein